MNTGLGIGAGTLKQSQCLQRAALRDAMEGCLYVISCWGSELQPVFRSSGGDLGDGDGGRGVADVVGAEYGSVASLLSEAARQSAVHFVHISAILGERDISGDDPSRSGGDTRRFAFRNDELCINMMKSVLKMMNFVFKILNSELKRWEFGRWWSSWTLSALLYRSTNEEALLWKKRAERLVRRAGGSCGLPYTIVRLAPLKAKARLERQRAKIDSLRGSTAMLYNDGIGVGSSACAEVAVSQLAGATRRRASLPRLEGAEHERFWGPIWEKQQRPAHLDHGYVAAEGGASAAADGSSSLLLFADGGERSSGTVQAIDPVDAARVALFCMGNSGTVGTSFEVRGRGDDVDAVEEAELEAGQAGVATTLLSDLLAPLLPDSEFVIDDADDGDLPSAEVQPDPLQAAAVAAAMAMRKVAPWSQFVDASVVTIIGHTDARAVTPPGSPSAAAMSPASTTSGDRPRTNRDGSPVEVRMHTGSTTIFSPGMLNELLCLCVVFQAVAPRGRDRWYRGHPLAREGEWEPFARTQAGHTSI